MVENSIQVDDLFSDLGLPPLEKHLHISETSCVPHEICRSISKKFECLRWNGDRWEVDLWGSAAPIPCHLFIPRVVIGHFLASPKAPHGAAPPKVSQGSVAGSGTPGFNCGATKLALMRVLFRGQVPKMILAWVKT